MLNIAVTSVNLSLQAQAKTLARALNLAWLESIPASHCYDFLLIYTPHYLGLQSYPCKKLQPFYIDFSAPRLQKRSAQAGLRKEWLARAIGMKPQENPSIIDATAGFGRDSFILSSLGFKVKLIERSPIVYALLKDAILRAGISRMQLIHADALKALSKAHVIYLDPMFPARRKSAAVKKEMAILQTLVGKEQDNEALFNLALSCATHRVVVKRPRLAPTITTLAPTYSLTGTTCRFDI